MTGFCLIRNLTFIGMLQVQNHFLGIFDSWDIWKRFWTFCLLLIFNVFCIFSRFEHQISPKIWKLRKTQGIFLDAFSKCPDIIRKYTPFLAHNLDSSPSMELKLLVNHYESPCMYIWLAPSWTNIHRQKCICSTVTVIIRKVWHSLPLL